MKINYEEIPKVRDFARFNEETFLAEIKAINNRNRTLYLNIFAKHQAFVKQAAELYGISSKEYKYIRNIDVPKPPNLERKKNAVLRNHQQHLYREAERERSRDFRERRKEALATLEEMGYVPNKDFPATRAVGFLQQVKRQERTTEHETPTTNAEES